MDRDADVARLGKRGRPRCMPMRSRTSIPSGQAAASIARWIASAASSAAGARSKTAKTSSPRADASRPPADRTAPRTRRRTSASREAYRSSRRAKQLSGAFEVGQQERDVARRQLALRLQLRADETDGHDPVLHRRPQQAVARAVPRGLVLEHHLAEPREGIAHMRRVVDRQTTSAARIDVRKGAVGKLRTLLRAERCHPRIIARPDTQSRRATRSWTTARSSSRWPLMLGQDEKRGGWSRPMPARSTPHPGVACRTWLPAGSCVD